MHPSIKTITTNFLASVIGLTLVTACGDDHITSPITAHGVAITLTVPGTCNGLCERPPAPFTKLASIHIMNSSDQPTYLEQCGEKPNIVQEHFDGSNWVQDPPAFTCPNGYGPIVLAAGASIDSYQFFPVGQFRVRASAATTAALTDSEAAISNQIAVKAN